MSIELKTDEGKLAPLQAYNLNKIADCGGVALVVTPSNEKETLIYLETFAKELGKSLPTRKEKVKSVPRKLRNYEH